MLYLVWEFYDVYIEYLLYIYEYCFSRIINRMWNFVIVFKEKVV